MRGSDAEMLKATHTIGSVAGPLPGVFMCSTTFSSDGDGSSLSRPMPGLIRRSKGAPINCCFPREQM